MVFFTCNACGESLKKAQVDKHVNICGHCQVLSCIDCGKDFWGEDYKNHVKCISEDQKYGGKNYEVKSNKGDVKQQQWLQRIHAAMEKPGVNQKLKDVLNQVSSYDNVPRKKTKFQNWMKNSLKISNTSLHDQVWEIFSEATSTVSNTPQDSQTPEQSAKKEAVENGSKLGKQDVNENPTEGRGGKKSKRERKEERRKKRQQEQDEEEPSERKSKKKRKRNMEEGEEPLENGHNPEGSVPSTKRKKGKEEDSLPNGDAEDDEEASDANGKFNWKGTIKAILRQSDEDGISVKKLRKKVLAAYYSFSGAGNFRSEEELLSLFNKKLNGNPKFRVLKDRVRLVK